MIYLKCTNKGNIESRYKKMNKKRVLKKGVFRLLYIINIIIMVLFGIISTMNIKYYNIIGLLFIITITLINYILFLDINKRYN